MGALRDIQKTAARETSELVDEIQILSLIILFCGTFIYYASSRLAIYLLEHLYGNSPESNLAGQLTMWREWGGGGKVCCAQNTELLMFHIMTESLEVIIIHPLL